MTIEEYSQINTFKALFNKTNESDDEIDDKTFAKNSIIEHVVNYVLNTKKLSGQKKTVIVTQCHDESASVTKCNND